MAFLKGLKRFLFVAVVVLALTAQEGSCDDSAEIGKDVQDGIYFLFKIIVIYGVLIAENLFYVFEFINYLIYGE